MGGFNFFDTANVYGWRQGGQLGEGLTEQIIGRWFSLGGGRREKVVLATKVYGKMGEWPNESGLSARHIVSACEASLRRLRVDHIDLYQCHRIDREAPWDEIWQAMSTLIEAGKILYVGSSNFSGWHIAKATEIARSRHLVGLVSEQCCYNLAVRQAELEILPACQDYGLGVIPWSPLAGGLLGGVLGNIQEGRRAEEKVRAEVERRRLQLEDYEALCADLGESPASVALAWLLANPVITAPVVGPRNVAQLEDALRSLEVRLEQEVLSRLGDIFPGPRAPAPEAWAF